MSADLNDDWLDLTKIALSVYVAGRYKEGRAAHFEASDFSIHWVSIACDFMFILYH